MKNIRVNVKIDAASFCPIDKTKEKSIAGASVGFYDMPEVLFSRNRTINDILKM